MTTRFVIFGREFLFAVTRVKDIPAQTRQFNKSIEKNLSIVVGQFKQPRDPETQKFIKYPHFDQFRKMNERQNFGMNSGIKHIEHMEAKDAAQLH